ncbi:hypothetical protein BDV36DRAFT_250507 [Aspergillus pseudocaelatus]|uniref:Uncharacterized protein n=1 Tax=Aspergillus pseudocaelatus TaxID=1825620 RepID=A0ABQ6WRW4_9EURO|nr:hypothetical protein BDV36DRAFT_250507 [Aspergillus pseudocaelatus]
MPLEVQRYRHSLSCSTQKCRRHGGKVERHPFVSLEGCVGLGFGSGLGGLGFGVSRPVVSYPPRPMVTGHHQVCETRTDLTK